MRYSFNKTVLVAVAIAGLGGGLAASAAAQDEVGRTDVSTKACFMVRKVEGYAPVRFSDGLDGVNVTDGKDVYQMKFANPCRGVRDATSIAVEAKRPSMYICNANDAVVVARSNLGPAERCDVATLRKLPPSEVASLPQAEQP